MTPGAEVNGSSPQTGPGLAREAAAPLSDLEYALEFKRLRIGMAFIQDIRCAAMLARVAESQSIAPVLDPTLYMHGRERLEVVQELLTAAGRFQAAIKKFDGRMAETADTAARSLEMLAQARPLAAGEIAS